MWPPLLKLALPGLVTWTGPERLKGVGDALTSWTSQSMGSLDRSATCTGENLPELFFVSHRPSEPNDGGSFACGSIY